MRYLGQPRIFGHPLGVGNAGQSLTQYLLSLGAGFYLPLTETTGSQATDISGAGLHGTYNGPTLAGDTLLGQPAPTFDGVNDYVQLEHVGLESVFDPASFTMMIMFKLSSAQRQDANLYMAYSIGVDGDNRCAIFKTAANTMQFQVEVGNVIKGTSLTLDSTHDGKWNMAILRASSSGNSVVGQVNTATNSTTYPAGTWTSSNLTAAYSSIGQQGSALYWPNALGQARLVNRVITAAEVTHAYNLFKAQEPNAA